MGINMDDSNVAGALIGIVIVLVVFVFPLVKIIRKAGYSGWWILIWLVPLANIVMLWVFAFADWPNLAKRST
jgi:hypothetical protein